VDDDVDYWAVRQIVLAFFLNQRVKDNVSLNLKHYHLVNLPNASSGNRRMMGDFPARAQSLLINRGMETHPDWGVYMVVAVHTSESERDGAGCGN